MARIRTDRLIAFDTEWTCWDGETPPGMEREIIEFGLVEYDPRAREIVREGRYLVRPMRSTVGAYCTELTGITPEEARRGRPLAEVVRSILKDFGTASKPSLAWGDDWSDVQRECDRIGAGNPFRGDGFLNLGLVYALQTGAMQRPGLAYAMGALDVEATGRAHSAVDDARNAVLVFEAMSEALPRPTAGPTP